MTQKSQHTTTEHPKPLTKHIGHIPFDAAIRQLVPDGNRKATLALFQGQVSFSGLRHWRKGRRSIPQWAKDMLATELAHGARRYTQARLELEAAPDTRQMAHNIIAHNARQKEKGRSKAAPSE